jgi:DNA-directed RNA polymerase II subunit RPB2
MDSSEKDKISWKIIDKFFTDNPNYLVAHHLESYNMFFNNGINRIFHENNPIRFIEREDEGNKSNNINEALLYLGGKDGSKIYFGKPIIFDDNNTHYMFPNDARLRNMTYGITIHYDVEVDFIYYNGEEKKEHSITLEKILLGRFPIMLQSELCILNTLNKNVRFNMGECRNDFGGYFIIDGKEKSIIPQETFADNMLYIKKNKKDDIYSHSAEIRSVSEDTSKPIRTTAVKIVSPSPALSNNQIVVVIPNVRKPMPLFILMRALGVISDKDIIKTCLLDIEKNESYIDLFIPSVHDANKIFNQETALRYIASFTKRGTISGIIEILSDFFLPHIGEMNFLNKAYFIGVMVFRLLKVYTKEDKPTDRDNFRFKRIEQTGSLIYDLFREYYLIQKKDISKRIDEEYYYHRGNYKDDEESEIENQKHKKNVKQRGEPNVNKYNNEDSFISLITTNFKEFFKDRIVEAGFKKAFKGNWGSQTHTKRVGVVQDLNRLSWNTFISQLRKINLPMDASAKVVGPRLLNSSQWGLIDPIDTPDGGNIGLHKHLAMSTHITSGTSSFPIIKWLRANTPMKIVLECTPEYLFNSSKIFVNGNWIGVINEPIALVNMLKLYRRNGIISVFTSILFDYKNNEINIYTDSGRLTRPIYYIEDSKLSFNKTDIIEALAKGTITWEQIVSGFKPKADETFSIKSNKTYYLNDLYPDIGEEGEEKTYNFLHKNQSIVEFIDTSEEESAFIATKEEDLKNNNYYTHMEIDASLIFGVMGNQIIYPEHNPPTRNAFSCGQSKQAVSMYHSNYQMRIDKMGVVLNYGQIPLIKSRYLEYINNEEQPYGINAIVAIMSFTGYNVEDAILINKSSVERGIFRTTYFSMYEASEESSKVAGMSNSKFANIEKNNVTGIKPGYDYSMLDDYGMIRENTPLNEKVIVIGKITSNSESKDEWTDSSVKPKKGQLGFVDKSFMTQGEEGFNIAKVRIREERVPAIGDKFASRSGQKGTIGLIIPEEDMPYTADGIRPDLIINPHAIPSRMTIGQIVESMFGKTCVTYGGFGDCTAFQVKGSNYSTYGPMLTKAGFHSSGNQLLYNGMTGEQLQANIYIGPTYYMRLKHMVKDKINYRARGPNTALTRQPVQGRANDGGLRIGEMERDGVLAHGMSYFLNESFMIRGDQYYMAVCNKTGAIAIYNNSKNLFLSPFADGPINFHTNPDGTMNIKNISKFGRSFSIVKIPYSFKLLIHELQIMNIQMRLITDENIDTLMSMSYSDNINKLLKTDKPIDEVIKDYLINIKKPPTIIEKTKITVSDNIISKATRINIIKNYNEAIDLVQKCLDNIRDNKKPKTINKDYIIPIEATDGPWSFDFDAAKRTLNYIYNVVYNTCYMLCVSNGYITSFSKLEPDGIPEFYQNEIEKTKLDNPNMFDKLGDNLRVMQCVVKAKKDVTTVSTEYSQWLFKYNIQLPDGAYIINLTDSVILRKDGKMPWEEKGADINTETSMEKYLPILGCSGAEGYWDIPIPNYDDINIILGIKQINKVDVPWADKISKAVFRGGPTGCGTNAETNMRIKLAEMRIENKEEYLDVGLITTTSNNPRFDPKIGLSKIQANVRPITRMEKETQSKYKYILHIDGNVAAYRLLEWMLLGSVILKVKGEYTLWVDHLLQDKVEYVSVKEDLSDLIDVIKWCRENDEQCKQIADNGRRFAEHMLNTAFVNSCFAQTLWGVNGSITGDTKTESLNAFIDSDKNYGEFDDSKELGKPLFEPHSPERPLSPDEPPPPIKTFGHHSPDEPPPQLIKQFSHHSPLGPHPNQTQTQVSTEKESILNVEPPITQTQTETEKDNSEANSSDKKIVKVNLESSSNSSDTKKITL